MPRSGYDCTGLFTHGGQASCAKKSQPDGAAPKTGRPGNQDEGGLAQAVPQTEEVIREPQWGAPQGLRAEETHGGVSGSRHRINKMAAANRQSTLADSKEASSSRNPRPQGSNAYPPPSGSFLQAPSPRQVYASTSKKDTRPPESSREPYEH